MEENKQHFQHIMLHYFKKDKNPTEAQKKIGAVYGKGAVTDQTCHEWFVKFGAGDFSRTMFHNWIDQLKLIAVKTRH